MKVNGSPCERLLAPGAAEDHEEDVFLDGLPLFSSSSSGASTIALTPRKHARYGLRGDGIVKADQLG